MGELSGFYSVKMKEVERLVLFRLWELGEAIMKLSRGEERYTIESEVFLVKMREIK